MTNLTQFGRLENTVRYGAVAGIAAAGAAGAAVVGSAAISSSANKKAANKVANAYKDYEKVDLDELQSKATAFARQNAINSLNLERELTPDVARTRETYNKQVADGKLKGDELWLATDSVRQKMVDTAAAFASASGQAEGTTGYIDAMITSLQNQAATLDPKSPLYQAIQGYIAQLLAIPTRIETDFRIKGDSITVNGRQIAVPARYAAGGHTSDDRPYIVGDNADGSLNSTSEMVVPGAGMVHSARDTQDILRALAGGGGGGVTINFGGVTLAGATDVDGFARALSMQMAVRTS